METTKAVQALAALAQETRLQAFRLLVQRGPDGMAAGAIAESLGVVRATLSFHLAQLERAELLNSRRQSRQIFYAANFGNLWRAVLAGPAERPCGTGNGWRGARRLRASRGPRRGEVIGSPREGPVQHPQPIGQPGETRTRCRPSNAT
jgi:ArsR family transcriptional regulator